MSNEAEPLTSGEASDRQRPEAVTGESGVVTFREVFEAELTEIVKRRHEAGLLAAVHDADAARAGVKSQLVGLSLSGGGIRSASFCLGFIQALYKTGLLRHIDYISSVSGGGYAAASLASEVMHPRTLLDWEDGKAAGSPPKGRGRHPVGDQADEGTHRPPGPAAGAVFGLAADRLDRQPPRVVDLVHGGAYLRRPRPFLNRWLIGVVLIGIVAVSGVAAAAALAAFLFRALDDVAASRVTDALGFKGDIQRALFPAALAFAAWLLAWAVSYWRRGERAVGEVAQWLLLLTVTLLLMALAALLGTGDIDMAYLRDLFGLSADNERFGWLAGYLKIALPGLIGFSLLPYLTPRELIRSGTRPRNALEGWVFAVASRGLLFGAPLVLFGWFAQENFSHYNEQRYLKRYGAKIPTVYDIVRADFQDWDDAWNRFELEAKHGGKADAPGLGRAMWDAVLADQAFLDATWDSHGLSEELDRRWKETCSRQSQNGVAPPMGPIDRWRLVWGWKVELDQKLGFLQRWMLAAAYVLTREQNDFIKIIWLDEYSARIQDAVCAQLTARIINAPDLSGRLSDVPTPGSLRSDADVRAWRQALNRLDEDGKSVNRAIHDVQYEGKPPGTKGGGTAERLPWSRWNRDRLEQRRKIDDLTARLTPWGRFWGWKTPDILEKEHKLRDHVFLNNGELLRLKNELNRLNWTVLQTAYPDQFYAKSKVFAKVVQPEDQKARLGWFAWSLAVFLIAGAVVNMNACSLHGFYKERLATMWIEPCPGMGQEIPLAVLETTTKGAPYHLFGATLNAMKLGAATAKAPEDVFLFSHAYCGSERTGFVPTERFARGRYDLASAVSLSGAALSPAYFQNPLLWTLMLLTNLRLGQWLPNPGYRRAGRWRGLSEAWGPVPLRLLAGMTTSAVSAAARGPSPAGRVAEHFFCYVTDGGYIENLGLEQLLLRRCRLVIVCDVSCDPASDFAPLMDVIRRVRTEQGVHIHRLQPAQGRRKRRAPAEGSAGHEDLGLQDLCPRLTREGRPARRRSGERLFSKEHVVLARILYPPVGHAQAADGQPGQARTDPTSSAAETRGTEGLLVYVKPTLTGDEDADLIRFWSEHHEFPHDSTMDQFYTPAKFESYRQLGTHSGRQVIKRLAELGRRDLCESLGESGSALVRYWANVFSEPDAPSRQAGEGPPAPQAERPPAAQGVTP